MRCPVVRTTPVLVLYFLGVTMLSWRWIGVAAGSNLNRERLVANSALGDDSPTQEDIILVDVNSVRRVDGVVTLKAPAKVSKGDSTDSFRGYSLQLTKAFFMFYKLRTSKLPFPFFIYIY